MGERIQTKKNYTCSFFDCNATFSKYWKLEAHICKHTGLKPFLCGDCDKNFSTHHQLTRHQLNHTGGNTHECQADECVESFATSSTMAKTHQHQQKCYKCSCQGCGKDFNKKHQLKAHAYEHTQLLPFHCAFTGCSSEFPSRGKLKHHEKTHEGYPCKEDGCPFQGKTWSEYQVHKKEHRVKLQCDKCHKQLIQARFLRLHQLRVHEGVKREFVCPQGCGKGFTRRFDLESHVLTEHEGGQRFSCMSPGCGKSFVMKESLWRHSVVHDPEKKKRAKLHSQKRQPSRKEVPGKGLAASTETHKLAAMLAESTLADAKP